MPNCWKVLGANEDVLHAGFSQTGKLIRFDRATRAVIKHRRAVWLVLDEQVDRRVLQAMQHADLHGQVAGGRIRRSWCWFCDRGHGGSPPDCLVGRTPHKHGTCRTYSADKRF